MAEEGQGVLLNHPVGLPVAERDIAMLLAQNTRTAARPVNARLYQASGESLFDFDATKGKAKQ